MNILNEVGLSGISVGIANICTSPLDMIKVRMQLSKSETNIYKIGTNIIQTEGIFICKYWIMNLEHGRSEMEKACSKCSYCDPSLLTCLPPPIGIPNGLKWVYNYETVELENKK